MIITYPVFAQDGLVTKIIDSKTVEINIGKSKGAKVGDKFKVFGKGQFLHPATGRMVEGDNIAIGEIIILEVMQNTSKAQVVNSTQPIATNARVEKTAEETQTAQVETKTQTYYQPEYESSYTKTSQEKEKKEKKEKKAKEPKGPFGWSLYLTASLNNTIGKFGAEVKSLEDFYDGNTELPNFPSFNLGYMFYLKNLDVGEGKKVGIDISSGVAFSPYFERSNDDGGYFASNMFYIPFRFGPVFSINPNKNLIVDAKLSFQFNLGYITTWYEDSSYDYYDWYSSVMFFRTSLGVYARYKKFMFGIDLTGGKVEGTFWNDWDISEPYKRPTTTLGFTIGVAI